MPKATGLIEHVADSYIAAAAMTKGQGCVLKTTAVQEIQASVAASKYVTGFLAHDAAAGAVVRVVKLGVGDFLITDGVVLAIGDTLAPDAGGTWKKVTTGSFWAISQGTTAGTTSELCRAEFLGSSGATY